MKRLLMLVSLLCLMFSITIIADETERFISGDFEYILLEDDTVEIVKYIGEASEIEVPLELDGYTVTSIGEHSFSFSVDENKTITRIILPESLTNIEEDAFLWCKSLPNITLPESITSIGGNPFTKCDNIQFDISPDHPYLEVIDGVLFSKPDKRLICCPGRIENYTVPEGITNIAGSAFFGSDNLTSVTLPESLTSIGDSAFYGCFSLTDINLPESLMSIGNMAFSDCDNLEGITLPESVTSIGNSAFSDCDSLTSIIIPEGLTSVADYAFSRCRNLTDITLPESLTSIGDFSFAKCDPVEIILPEGLMSIGKRAFVECENLTSITLPESMENIGEEAFLGCESLTSITLPEGVTSIGDDAFFDCEDLTIIVQRDSYAAHYCEENDLNYSYTDIEGTDNISLSGKDSEEDSSDDFRSDRNVVEGKYYGMCGYYDEMYLDIIPEDTSKTRGKCIGFDAFSQEFSYTIEGNILSVKDNLDYEIYKDYLIPHEHDYSGIIPDEAYFDTVVRRETNFSTEEIHFSEDGQYISTYKSSSLDSVETGTYEREGELIKFIGDESYNVKYGNIEYGIVKDGVLNNSASVFKKGTDAEEDGADDLHTAGIAPELEGSWNLIKLVKGEEVMSASELGLSGGAKVESDFCSINISGVDIPLSGDLSPSPTGSEGIYLIKDGDSRLGLCTLSGDDTLIVLIDDDFSLLFERVSLGSSDTAGSYSSNMVGKVGGNSTSSVSTTGERNALEKALQYLDYSAFSYSGLVDQLEYEGFTHSEATFAADNCGANWKDQATQKALSYLDYSAFSYSGLIEQLEYEGFSSEEAKYGVDNCNADWNEQAAKKAEEYLNYSSFSRSGLLDQLIYEGFTQSQAEYGVSKEY